MSWASDIAVGVIVVVAVVGGIIWLARRGTFEQESADETGEEREEFSESVGQQDFHIPFRRRIKTWSGPYKVFVGSLSLLAGLALVGGYQVMKTGSPADQFLSSRVRIAASALIGIAGGVKLKEWFDSQLGYLDIEYEQPGRPPVVERIPYAKNSTRRSSGAARVAEVAQNRLFGLFWRYRQVGEDRRLRGADKPLDDVITHKVPDHAAERPDGSGFQISTHEGGDKVLSGATSAADVTYSSPNSLSDERAIQLREQKKRMEVQLRAMEATNGQLYQRVEKLEKKIDNDEYRDRTELMEDLDRFSSFLSTFTVELDEKGKSNGDGSAVENGEKAEASA